MGSSLSINKDCDISRKGEEGYEVVRGKGDQVRGLREIGIKCGDDKATILGVGG